MIETISARPDHERVTRLRGNLDDCVTDGETRFKPLLIWANPDAVKVTTRSVGWVQAIGGLVANVTRRPLHSQPSSHIHVTE